MQIDELEEVPAKQICFSQDKPKILISKIANQEQNYFPETHDHQETSRLNARTITPIKKTKCETSDNTSLIKSKKSSSRNQSRQLKSQLKTE